MGKWAKIYHEHKSLVVCSEVTLLLILVAYLEGAIWIIAPIVFPLMFAFTFSSVDKSVWKWYHLPMYCILIVLFFVYIIKFSAGTHDDVGKFLIQIAHSATFLISFVVIALMRANAIANASDPNISKPNGTLALKPISVMLAAFAGSYILMTYLNYNL